MRYFKNTIVGFASNDNIFLSGIILCGLYIHKKKQEETVEENQKINNISIPLQIIIMTMKNKSEGEKIYTEKFELNSVFNADDPCFCMNFEKAVKIMKEKLYLIKIENLSSNSYTEIWTGNVGKNTKKDIQVIRCHNTGIQFLFKQAEGIQTDFDEFENGIIEGVLYSKSK